MLPLEYSFAFLDFPYGFIAIFHVLIRNQSRDISTIDNRAVLPFLRSNSIVSRKRIIFLDSNSNRSPLSVTFLRPPALNECDSYRIETNFVFPLPSLFRCR